MSVKAGQRLERYGHKPRTPGAIQGGNGQQRSRPPVSKSPVRPSGLGNRAEPTVPHQLQPLGYSHVPGRVQVVFGSSCAQTRSLAYA